MVRFCSNRNSRGLCFLAVLLLVLGLTGPVFAQTDVTTSRISGTVEDSEGAPLPGVTVTATNTETGLVQTTVTDERGFYRVLNLPTGTY
ncbi:MAG TPA: carboxypeptidase-like regulatory domain-containing protein, partial [Thermoanaerobaculia bacterium]|nr:carboxypeptidase-like regulatory domain-containing protein [Thermoanaerobaculia bacterium]